MTLVSFIQKYGVHGVAQMLKTDRPKIYQWGKLESAPTLQTAFKLIVLSKGKLTFDHIYKPYAEKKYKGKKFTAEVEDKNIQLSFRF